MRLTPLVAAVLLLSGCNSDAESAASPVISQAPTASRGLSVELDVHEVQGRTYEFTFRVEDDDGGGPGYILDYGDGQAEELMLAIASCPVPSPLPSPTPSPVRRSFTFTHVYADAGSYPVSLRVISRPLCGEAQEEIETIDQVLEVA